MAPSGSRRLAIVLALLVVGALVLLVVLAEAAVRIRLWAKTGSMSRLEETFKVDPGTGLRGLKPNMVQGGLRTNSLGFRGPEIVAPKPAGVIRLAFLGASTTYCAEINVNELTWPHLVTDAVAGAKPSARFDYVNGAVPGYGYENILKSFRLRVKPLAPDVVVIYEASNDLSADTRKLAQSAGLVGERVIRESWPSQYLLLWFLVEKNLTVRSRQASAASATGKLTNYEPRAHSAQFGDRLRQTILTAQQTARVVAVATFSTRLRREQSLEARKEAAMTALFYMPYMTLDGLLAGFEEYNRVIRETARETGALLIEGENRVPPDGRHFADSVHFSEAGSRVMAQRVTEALLAAPAFERLVAMR